MSVSKLNQLESKFAPKLKKTSGEDWYVPTGCFYLSSISSLGFYCYAYIAPALKSVFVCRKSARKIIYLFLFVISIGHNIRAARNYRQYEFYTATFIVTSSPNVYFK